MCFFFIEEGGLCITSVMDCLIHEWIDGSWEKLATTRRVAFPSTFQEGILVGRSWFLWTEVAGLLICARQSSSILSRKSHHAQKRCLETDFDESPRLAVTVTCLNNWPAEMNACERDDIAVIRRMARRKWH